MPLYEYECQSCHQRLEKRQKFSDPPLTECPHCGGKLEKCLTAPAVQFKGGGWYADGYGNKKSSGASSNSNASSGSSAASSSSGDSASSSSSDSTAKTTTPAASSTPASTTSSSSDKK